MIEKKTDSGISVEPLYTAKSLNDFDAPELLGVPGAAPYTRGIYPTMHRERLWTMRQYAGFGTAADTNERFKFLLNADRQGCRARLICRPKWVTTVIIRVQQAK